jgi:two-component system nitrate/nitrite response regulator NarL
MHAVHPSVSPLSKSHSQVGISVPVEALRKSTVPEERRQAVSKKRLRVLVVDDHPVVRKGISICLARRDNMEVVGEAANGAEALRKVRELAPDIVLLDINMPQMDGLAVTEALRKDFPNVRVILLSVYSNTEYVLRIIRSGASGYVLKEAEPEELVRAVESVGAGGSFFSSEVARVALNQFVRGPEDKSGAGCLTNREREVLIQIAEGGSNKEIACHLGVGVRTVETHRERIMRKLNIHSVAGLTKFAIARGLITLTEDFGG